MTNVTYQLEGMLWLDDLREGASAQGLAEQVQDKFGILAEVSDQFKQPNGVKVILDCHGSPDAMDEASMWLENQ